MKLAEYFADVDDDFARFFRELGYTVTWDLDKRGRWYEILDQHGLICQVDSTARLQDFLEDLPALLDGRAGTSASTYECRCPIANWGRFRELGCAVQRHLEAQNGALPKEQSR